MEIEREMKRSTSQIMSEQMRENIDRFLTAKRYRIMTALERGGSLTQGALAKEINSSATSLANIIQRFNDECPDLLLKAEDAGKYRYYTLTELGLAYVRDRQAREGHTRSGEELSEIEEQRLFQKAKQSLAEFQRICADGWETTLDDALCRICRGDKRGHGEEEIYLDGYLNCLELLILNGSEGAMNRTLNLLDNNILRDRVAELMRKVEPFCVVLKSLQQEANAYTVFWLMERAFEGQKGEAVDERCKALGWSEGEYKQLSVVAHDLWKCMHAYDGEEIYNYFQALLPEQRQLCAYIACMLKSREGVENG